MVREILRNSPYSVRIRGKCGPEKLRIQTLFTQCYIYLFIYLFITSIQRVSIIIA